MQIFKVSLKRPQKTLTNKIIDNVNNLTEDNRSRKEGIILLIEVLFNKAIILKSTSGQFDAVLFFLAGNNPYR